MSRRRVEQPRNASLSLRITPREAQELQRYAELIDKNISAIHREALERALPNIFHVPLEAGEFDQTGLS